jgi:hypothetical protein
MSSSPVLAGAVKRSGSRISIETLRQRLQVEVAPDADVLTIRVVDSNAKGAAQLADAVAAAYEDVLAQPSLQIIRQLQTTLRRLQATLAGLDAELADRPDNRVLQARRAACAAQLSAVQRQLMEAQARAPTRPSVVWQRAAVPQQPISPGLVVRWRSGCCWASSPPPSWCGGSHAGRGRRPDPRPEQGAISHRT